MRDTLLAITDELINDMLSSSHPVDFMEKFSSNSGDGPDFPAIAFIPAI
ncbi:hypothetical protein PJK45_19035 [Mycobacterium kansasii]|uniref:Uncharacterized protein n=3 Tax=Mycobacterium kansasii TaxID=1768 RepID=A0A1V3WWA6_MYCKA|nr:hypothetical protein [Mycobacterium kansasii]EUA03789.1 hypothetical protein I547_2536 [Mycobacterium kansasii 824]AGZ54264.1 hypothetical protein MKAN_15335 [Mycobacterium kansasii ATCC 12478]EUA13581.1 hypothetical protein I545_4732 [Mycobacterium kansasii 662]KEP44812.1 hypothetical protein MKSMC1_00530 [Mycobacterium kansasii]OOK71205.1 hypothetical protein BZL29_5679 [Mycobacterium kansasii]